MQAMGTGDMQANPVPFTNTGDDCERKMDDRIIRRRPLETLSPVSVAGMSSLVCRNPLPLLVLLLLLPASVAGVSSRLDRMDPQEEQRLGDFIKRVLECRQVPAASMALVKDGRLVLTKGFGYTSMDSRLPVTPNTRFCIGSLTKAFTATVLAILLNGGNNSVTWDTPLVEVMGPDFRMSDDVRTHHVTLRDLLSHRVGVPEYFRALLVGIPTHVTREELVRRIRFMPAAEPMRTKFLYSNYMYTLAGHVAERLSGRKWEDLVQDFLLSPLGMTSSGFIDRLYDFSDFALPCAMKDGHLYNLEPSLLHSVHPCGPAGSIFSTAADMGRWLQMLTQGGRGEEGQQVVGEEALKETWHPGMPSPFPHDDITRPSFPVVDYEVSYDLGWVTSIYRGYKRIWHSGGIVTHSSRLWLFPDAKAAIYLAVNGPQTRRKAHALRAIMSYTADMLLGEEPWLNLSTACTYPAPWGADSSLTPAELAAPPPVHVLTRPQLDYEGPYFHRGFGEIVVARDNASLTLRFGRFGSMRLTPVSDLKFMGRYFGPLWFVTGSDDFDKPEDIQFVEGENGRIRGLLFPVDSKYNASYFHKDSLFPFPDGHEADNKYLCLNQASSSFSILSLLVLLMTLLIMSAYTAL